MELEQVKKFLREHIAYLPTVIADADTANRYYQVQNDILFQKNDMDSEKPVFRNADNRVCSSFYPLLVDQKSAYIFTSPPLFDVGNQNANQKISGVLGDSFPKVCKKLCKEASNSGVSWLHYWRDSKTNEFRFGVLSGTQVIPVVSDDIEEKLLGVIRVYRRTEDDGKTYIIYEIWNERQCEAYRREENLTIDDGLFGYSMFEAINNLTGVRTETNLYTHDFGRVPFIPFANNESHTNDLKRIKGLIDTYDKTFNGFANDLEDIQEVILVLSGYSGTDLGSFLDDLKRFKTIKLDDPASGGVNTLNIEIPVEARKEMLELTRKAIFTEGQGVDPDPQNFGNASGVALQFLYSLLELKAGNLQTEFQEGFSALVRAICNFYHLPIKNDRIIQTWTRNAIKNDTEQATIAKDSVGIVSKKTILKNHPMVEDADAEMEELKKEEEEQDLYAGSFSQNQNDDSDDDEENLYKS